MKPPRRVVFLVQRIGPYHHARLQALGADRSLSVHAVEFLPGDAVYAWDQVRDPGLYERILAGDDIMLRTALERISPDVVVCAGYSDREVHLAAGWAVRRGIPLVTCSDSNFSDEPRTWMRERLKRMVVSTFDSGLVAGSRAHEYLGALGMEYERRFSPWDVVDNEHFRAGAELARGDSGAIRRKMGLPERYFLCVARFVPKKNIDRLLEAYARYAGGAGYSAWSLVLSGAGPLEANLKAAVAKAGLKDRVLFPGFLQYPDLPACYGLAGAFVLASTSDQWGLVVNEAMAAGLPVIVSSGCGCAPDLVREGENGFVIDPGDSPALSQALGQMATMEPAGRVQMGVRSMELIAGFTPARFAEALKRAVNCAETRRRRKGLLSRIALGALLLRRRM
jgi:glycosyltransferase involved in cell wall biosynthesis